MKLIITLASIHSNSPDTPNAYAAVCRYHNKRPTYGEIPEGPFIVAEGAARNDDPVNIRRRMALLLRKELIEPASQNDDDTVTLRTENHDDAVAVLTECQFICSGGILAAECGNLGLDHDLQLAAQYAKEAQDAAAMSGIEFNSVAHPDILTERPFP